MSYLLSSYHLRAPGARNTTKDWIVEIYTDKIITRWGTTGTNLQSKEFKDLRKFQGNDPTLEGLKRRDKKLREGYHQVDSKVDTVSMPKKHLKKIKPMTLSQKKRTSEWFDTGKAWF